MTNYWHLTGLEVKSAKAINAVCQIRVKDYQRASQNLKEELLRQYQENKEENSAFQEW